MGPDSFKESPFQRQQRCLAPMLIEQPGWEALLQRPHCSDGLGQTESSYSVTGLGIRSGAGRERPLTDLIFFSFFAQQHGASLRIYQTDGRKVGVEKGSGNHFIKDSLPPLYSLSLSLFPPPSVSLSLGSVCSTYDCFKCSYLLPTAQSTRRASWLN